MSLGKGSELQYTPDSSKQWIARYRDNDDGRVLLLPVVGWSVVVTWTPDEGDKRSCETGVQPVVLMDSGYLTNSYWMQESYRCSLLGVSLCVSDQWDAVAGELYTYQDIVKKGEGISTR